MQIKARPVQSDIAKLNSTSAASGRDYSLESNQFVDHRQLKRGHRLDEPFAFFRRGR
jgi:hypothetical protein